jgi:hypothetical protein
MRMPSMRVYIYRTSEEEAEKAGKRKKEKKQRKGKKKESPEYLQSLLVSMQI